MTSIGSEKYDKNSLPIIVPSKNFPDFNSSIVTCDIIEEEFCQEGYLQILKCVSLDLNETATDRAVCKNYDHMIYKKIKKDVNNIVRTIKSINIKINLLYCVLFILFKCQKKTFLNFLNNFSYDTFKNDKEIEKMILNFN